jgi:hypothetical protein
MQVVYRRCAGLDVHKDSITATILVFPEEGERQVRTQEFRTYWKDLQLEGSAAAGAMAAQFIGGMRGDGVDWRVLEAGLGFRSTGWSLLRKQEYSGEDLEAGAGQSVSDQEHSVPEDGPARQRVDC